ncbi:ribonuclease D [uncultured Parvibaculum sp.]|uniref:ribonuclease D n=1 Tax=uncultured Parvibaculum sp. TaxID=291828 RepID=UPI0030DC90C5|tara:strand:- start:104850 stop:106007 length:1158 start_codon:yes stop_codon:yes gene_type:complete
MEIITTNEALRAVCSRLSKAGFVTVDTEFMRDSTFWPILCLIQLAGPEDEVIVDPLAPDIDLAPFYALMRNPKVVKVFHAARQDIEIFYHEGDTIPDPLFDTQVAAMVCGFGDSVGYETLVKRLAGGEVDKSSRFTDWSRRPLSEKQLNYAIKDVTYLRTIYEVLAKRLTQTKRARWVAEEMSVLQNPETYAMRPENAWKRVKGRFRGTRGLAVLVEVAAWRERQAQERDMPRSRIMKDDALAEIATQIPRSLSDLDGLRAVPKGFSNSRSAASLMEAIERGLAMKEEDIPVVEGPEPLPPGIGPLVELLKVLLKIKCEEHDVAQKLVANVADLERIAAHAEPDVPALKGWRRELFGEDALRLKRGELAIGANGRKILLIETGKR